MSTESYTFPESIEHPAQTIQRDQLACAECGMEMGQHPDHHRNSAMVCRNRDCRFCGFYHPIR